MLWTSGKCCDIDAHWIGKKKCKYQTFIPVCPETCWSNFRLFIGLLEASSIIIVFVFKRAFSHCCKCCSNILQVYQVSFSCFPPFCPFRVHPHLDLWNKDHTRWCYCCQRLFQMCRLSLKQQCCHVHKHTRLILGFGRCYITGLKVERVLFSCIFLKNGTASLENLPKLVKIQSSRCCFLLVIYIIA